MNPCPLCGAPTERVIGLIVTPMWSPHRDAPRPLAPIKRLGTYVLCTGCEYGEEA